MASRNRWYDYAVAIWLGFVLLWSPPHGPELARTTKTTRRNP